MTRTIGHTIRAAAAALAVFSMFALPAIGGENDTAGKTQGQRQKLVMQVSDAEPGKWGLALNNAYNVQETLGKDKVDIEIVAYGPGLGMLKLDSLAGARVDEALKRGVKLVACEITMQKQNVTRADMLPNISYVPAGVVELMKKQQQGYSYIRP